jgi:hypothetical protein
MVRKRVIWRCSAECWDTKDKPAESNIGPSWWFARGSDSNLPSPSTSTRRRGRAMLHLSTSTFRLRSEPRFLLFPNSPRSSPPPASRASFFDSTSKETFGTTWRGNGDGESIPFTTTTSFGPAFQVGNEHPIGWGRQFSPYCEVSPSRNLCRVNDYHLISIIYCVKLLGFTSSWRLHFFYNIKLKE